MTVVAGPADLVVHAGNFESVACVTSPGARVGCVVSTMGRVEKRGGETLLLTGYFPRAGTSRDEGVRERDSTDAMQ